MLGQHRWIVRDVFGARWTFVRSARASADDRARALPGHVATLAVDRMFVRPREVDWHVLIELAEVPTSDVRHYAHDQLKLRVQRRVGVFGALLLLGDQPHPSGTSTGQGRAAPDPERRVVATIMGDNRTLVFSGWQYRLVGLATATARGRRDDFETVRLQDARDVISRFAASASFTLAQCEALKEAVDLLVDPAQGGASKGLVLLRRPVRASAASTSEPAITPSDLRAAARKDITLTFLEAGTRRPVAGAALILAGPDDNQSRVTTSSAGVVTLTALDPGQCVATSIIKNALADASFVPGASGPVTPRSPGDGDPSPIQPSWLVEVDEVRVKTGDTTDSLAQDAGMPWNDIARFNWNTTDPAKLQGFFRDRVGCTKKTADGKAFVFDDADDPGIVLIPRPWTGSFAVGTAHTILVAPLRSVYISLENELGLAIPGASYETLFADGSARQGRLGRSGIACLSMIPEGPFSVAYPDQQDVLARSLAVSTRRAFDQQATGPLFFLLGQEQAVIDKAVAFYQQSFNDLSGRGLAADIDQVVTDADARSPLVFLCALAGLPIEGTDGVKVQNGVAGEPTDG